MKFRNQMKYYNHITSLFLQILNILVGLIVPQMILNRYGSEYYGMISSIQQVLAYLILLESGLAITTIQALYFPCAHIDDSGIKSILHAANLYYEKVSKWFLVGLCFVSILYPLFVKEQIPYLIATGLLFVTGIVNVFEFRIQSKYSALLNAKKKLYIYNLFYMCSVILGFAFKVFLIYMNVHIVIVQATGSIINILRTILIAYYTVKKYSLSDYKKIQPNTNALNQRNAAFTHQIAGLVVNNSPMILLTVITGDLNKVSLFAVYNYVFASLSSVLSSTFSTSSMAHFGEVLAINDINLLKSRYNQFEFIYYIVMSIIYSVAAIMILPFVKLYTLNTSDDNFVQPLLAILFLIASVLNSLRVPMITMINAAGHFKKTQNRALIEAIINLSVSVLLVPTYGVYGVVIASISSYSFRTVETLIYNSRHIVKATLKNTILRIISMILTGILSYYAVSIIFNTANISIETWTSWILSSLVCLLFVSIISIIINLLFEPRMIKSVIHFIFDK